MLDAQRYRPGRGVDYRLYCIDQAGKAEGTAQIVEANSDDEAIVLSRIKKLPVRCELWERDRLVATIPPFDIPASAGQKTSLVGAS